MLIVNNNYKAYHVVDFFFCVESLCLVCVSSIVSTAIVVLRNKKQWNVQKVHGELHADMLTEMLPAHLWIE